MEQNNSVDRGWAWLVLCGSFMSYLIADGWSYSFGILFPEIVDAFGESKGKTALIPTLLYGIPMIISPFVCVLINLFTCRLVGIAGGLITGLSFFLAAFATSVDYLCVVIGLLGSIGLAMVYVPALVIVTCYFEKHRGLATALAVTGSGLGAIGFPPLLYLLMQTYTWKGMFLIASGLAFNIMPSSALYRPLTSFFDDTKSKEINDDVQVANERSEQNTCDTEFTSAVVPSDELSCEANQMTEVEKCAVSELRDVNVCVQSCHLPNECIDVKYSGTVDSANVNVDKREVCKADSAKGFNEKCADFLLEVKSLPSEIFNKQTLSNSLYLIFCAGNFLLFLWISMPYVYLYDRALELEFREGDALSLLSLIAIGRLVGQLVLGVVGDLPFVGVDTMYSLSAILGGFMTLLVPLLTTYPGLAVYSVVFGVAVSAASVLPLMCLVQILGLQQATNAFGFLQLVEGLGTLLGTPVSGWLCDVTGSYETSFFIAGAWIMLSGCVMSAIPLIRKYRESRTGL